MILSLNGIRFHPLVGCGCLLRGIGRSRNCWVPSKKWKYWGKARRFFGFLGFLLLRPLDTKGAAIAFVVIASSAREHRAVGFTSTQRALNFAGEVLREHRVASWAGAAHFAFRNSRHHRICRGLRGLGFHRRTLHLCTHAATVKPFSLLSGGVQRKTTICGTLNVERDWMVTGRDCLKGSSMFSLHISRTVFHSAVNKSFHVTCKKVATTLNFPKASADTRQCFKCATRALCACYFLGLTFFGW